MVLKDLLLSLISLLVAWLLSVAAIASVPTALVVPQSGVKKVQEKYEHKIFTNHLAVSDVLLVEGTND